MNSLFADKIGYLILLGTSLSLGFFISAAFGLFFRKTDKWAFVKDKGYELSMFILVSMFGAPFCSLFIWFVIYFSMDQIFSYPLDARGRMLLFLCVCAVVFIGNIIYFSRYVLTDKQAKK